MSVTIDPYVQELADSDALQVLTTLMPDVHPHEHISVPDFIKTNRYMVPANDGRLYIARYDKKHWELINNSLGDLKLVLCSEEVISSILGESGRLNDQNVSIEENKMMQEILGFCMKESVSDLHIIARGDQVKFRRRIDGDLYDLSMPSIYSLDEIEELGSSLLNFHTDESGGQSKENFNPRVTQDASFSVRINHKEVLIRYSHLPANGGIDIVLRILAGTDHGCVDIDTLGYPREQAELILRVAQMPSGIILTCGATGSGKTTTQAAMLSSQPGTRQVYSYEDPIEINLSNVTQVPVNTNIKEMSWESLATNSLRMDPDVIQLGEIRSTEIAMIAFQVAATGHLCLSTLHTNDAPGAIERLLDLGLDKNRLASPTGIRLIIAQMLIPLLCESCKVPLSSKNHIDANHVKRVLGYFEGRGVVRVEGEGCERCNGRGVSGRQVIAETIFIDAKSRKYIKNGDIDGWITYLKEKGWNSISDYAEKYISAGKFDPFTVENKIGISFGVNVDEYDYV